jgi:hypothetical protein
MRRDVYVHQQRLSSYVINSVIIRPLCLIVCLGYVLQKAGMVVVAEMPQGAFFAGAPVMYLFSLAVSINFEYLFDFEHDRHLDFQRLLLSPSWLIMQKILMGSVVLFACTLPFYPITKLILGDMFATNSLGLLKVIPVVWMACWLTTGVFYTAVGSIRHSTELSMIWRAFIYPLFMLGGSLVPWKVTAAYWPSLGYLLLANPYVYVTEGFRQALFGSSLFFPLPLCLAMMFFFSILFTILAIWLFRRKVDAV